MSLAQPVLCMFTEHAGLQQSVDIGALDGASSSRRMDAKRRCIVRVARGQRQCIENRMRTKKFRASQRWSASRPRSGGDHDGVKIKNIEMGTSFEQMVPKP